MYLCCVLACMQHEKIGTEVLGLEELVGSMQKSLEHDIAWLACNP